MIYRSLMMMMMMMMMIVLDYQDVDRVFDRMKRLKLVFSAPWTVILRLVLLRRL